MRAAAVLLAAAALAACDCGGDTLGGAEVGFRVDGRPIDFGRAIEGSQVGRSVTLVATGRVDVTVNPTTEGPFAAAPELVVPGGAEAVLDLAYTAGVGKETGRLHLTANGKTVSLSLLGEGVRPLGCVPSAPCRVSRFVLETNRCAEVTAADGAGCVAPSACLENGQCQAGVCVGVARTCDDQNACTTDACNEQVGCLNAPVACPPPSAPCRIPACDPVSGCGSEVAPDGFPCGPVDCVTANLCLAGACRTFPTPEGFLCSPKTPCQGEGTCQSQACVRPDAGVMTPSYTVNLPVAPAPTSPDDPAVVAHAGNLFWMACGDGDAGCQLTSYTASGFQRFARPHDDPGARRVVAATDAGVLVLAADRLESFSAANGDPLWTAPLSLATPPPELPGGVARTRKDRLAVTAGGEVVATVSWYAADGGLDGGVRPDAGALGAVGPALANVQTLLRLRADGGLAAAQLIRGRGAAGRVALDEREVLYLYDPAGPLDRADAVDGGFLLHPLGAHAGGPSLVVAGPRLLAGATHLVSLDAGTRFAGLTWTGTELREVLPRQTLLSGDAGHAFYRSCRPAAASCAELSRATTVRAFDPVDGRTYWEADVLPENAPGWLEESAQVGGGAVMTLTQVELDGGPQSHVQLFAEGERLFVCPLPSTPAPPVLGGAVFDRGFLYALVRRGTQWRLEAYDLQGVPVSGRGWPARDGVGGTRRAR